jgi:hypothetical protein
MTGYNELVGERTRLVESSNIMITLRARGRAASFPSCKIPPRVYGVHPRYP